MDLIDNTQSRRNYDVEITESEIEDIHYIITTLGTSSIFTITASASSLKKIGHRIDHIHPLKFISYLLANEELKTNLLLIKERMCCISDKFFNGLYDGFETENSLDNLKTEYLNDVAKNLNIDSKPLNICAQECDWKGLVETLIKVTSAT